MIGELLGKREEKVLLFKIFPFDAALPCLALPCLALHCIDRVQGAEGGDRSRVQWGKSVVHHFPLFFKTISPLQNEPKNISQDFRQKKSKLFRFLQLKIADWFLFSNSLSLSNDGDHHAVHITSLLEVHFWRIVDRHCEVKRSRDAFTTKLNSQRKKRSSGKW